jgi:uncharacterized protein (DUF2237 family)
MASNVLGTTLESCSRNPLTGFFRTGTCDTCAEDVGMHTVCAVMTDVFLEFSRSRGNDLSTPRPDLHFPGLKDGDRWCICLGRWIEAYQAGVAPKIRLEATHISVLEFVSMEILREFACP